MQEIFHTDGTIQTSTEATLSPDEHGEGSRNITNDALEAMTKGMQELVIEMQGLRQDFDTKLKYDESKERQVDSLHQELQAYRAGLHFKILRPLFVDLIALHDDLDKMVESMTMQGQAEPADRTVRNLRSFQETIEEILRRNGVEVFTVDGDEYLANRQRALQVVDTADPALDKRIARRMRKGFEYENKVLRPELVLVYRVVAEK